MEQTVRLPIIEKLIPGGFGFGANYVVEFEPQSLWYETSLTICAQALRAGFKSDYHTFTHVPDDIRAALTRLGLDLKRLEENDVFRVWDSYTVQGGIDVSAKIGMANPRERVDLRSVKMSDWDREEVKEVRAGFPEIDLERLHIDDNTSVLLQYNSEKEVIDHFRTITVQHARRSRLVLVHSLISGIYSDSFYRQFESFCDGIIDFKSTEEAGTVNHLMRVRLMRGRGHDSRWVKLGLQPSGEVEVLPAEAVSHIPLGKRGSGTARPLEQTGPRETGPGPSVVVSSESARFLEEHDVLDLARYAVVGNYLRYDGVARNLLKDLRQNVVSAFHSRAPKHENYLIWAPPGSGKTSFVRQLGSALGEGVRYTEISLAETRESDFREMLAESRRQVPSLCLVDEVDSKERESWPFEALLASLDADAEGGRRVYVLAGSGGDSIEKMKERISSRPKGKDLLSRIPSGNEYSIPGMNEIDSILVFLSVLGDAASRLGKQIDEVEKLGLYYVATSSHLATARGLREFALRCAERVPKGDERLKYDNMFEAGDPANKEFWVSRTPKVPNLVNSFLKVENPGAPGRIEGERRLAAIMFTDTVESTALAQRNEALAMELIEAERKMVRSLLSKHNGREVKTMGDGFLVEFSSALDAIKCAVAIQSTQKELNDERPEGKRLKMRIGIHLGDVIHTGTDVAGDAVNIAARIEALASPGGVCVTAQVYSSVVNKVEYDFEGLGTPDLKGIATPIEVYAIKGIGEGRRIPIQARAPPADRVAVLPFTNIGLDKADEYFADGMTEEMISFISKAEGLRVIARTSVMKYKATSKPVSEIGRELNVGSVLEGSVRKAGDRVRITVQLVDASSEESKWSQQYDRELRDIFVIQSDISQKVAAALRIHVLGPPAKAETQPTSNIEAYVNYLRGRQAWNGRTESGLKSAIRFFEEALRVDPKYAKAYTGLADSYATLALLEFMAPNEAYPKAKKAVEQALSLDNRLAEAHTSLGLIKFQYDWDWRGAEEEFRGSIAINPSYAPAHHFFADYLKAMGRFDEALQEIKKAQDLDPLSLAISAGVGHVLYLSRRNEEAIAQYRKAVELEPNFMQTHVWFGRPYLEKGMYLEALAELETGVRLSGEGTLALAMLGHGLASAGRKEEAMAILDKLNKRSEQQYVPSYWIAVVYNGMRERDQVIAWLQKAYDERSSWLVWANVEPRFAWLGDDPDFRSLMGAMKFP